MGRVLRSEITDGSADGGGEVGVFVQVDGFRQPEIRHTGLQVVVDEDVGRLDVAVNDLRRREGGA